MQDGAVRIQTNIMNGYIAKKVVDEDIVWKHCRYAVYAEKGRTLYEEFGKWEIVYPDHAECGITTADEYESLANKAQVDLIYSLIDWIEDENKISGSNLKMALHQWNVVLYKVYITVHYSENL